jgi:hypothetical protein
VLRLLHLKNSSLIFGAFQIISGLVYRGHVTWGWIMSETPLLCQTPSTLGGLFGPYAP